MILASKSTWFHNIFQSTNKLCDCAVAFFGISESLVRNCIDIIYGKEVQIPKNSRNKMTWLLKKLGISWQEINQEDSTLHPDSRVHEQSGSGEKCFALYVCNVDLKGHQNVNILPNSRRFF